MLSVKKSALIFLINTIVFQLPIWGEDYSIELVKLEESQLEAKLPQLRKAAEKSNASDKDLKELGIALHILNEKKIKKELVEEGIGVFKNYLKNNKTDYEALAWYGSLITMQADYEKNPGKQTYYVKLGTKKMDQAVKKNPTNIPIRFIRGYNSITLPAFLERGRFGVEDFEYVVNACKTESCIKGRAEEAAEALSRAKSLHANKDL